MTTQIGAGTNTEKNNDNRKEHYAIFSRSGFTKEIKEGSDSDLNIHLYDLDDMKQVFEK
ncbi:MAG: hypothetical protein R6W73_10185 [Candidatus Saliniplasma sp.]